MIKNKKKEQKKLKELNKKQNTNIKYITDHEKYNLIFKNALISINHEYTLLTNLSIDNYNDEKIKELYKQRWNIEIFFKLLKYNFKFEHLVEHNKNLDYEQYKKLYLVNLTIIYLSKIIEKTYFYNNNIKKNFTKYDKKKFIEYVYKPNKSNIIKGAYIVLENLINLKFYKNNLINICNICVKYKYVKLGEYKERKAKTPFFKWYVKGHSERSLMIKFVEVYIFNNINILNKNTKMLYKTCKIKINNLKNS